MINMTSANPYTKQNFLVGSTSGTLATRHQNILKKTHPPYGHSSPLYHRKLCCFCWPHELDVPAYNLSTPYSRQGSGAYSAHCMWTPILCSGVLPWPILLRSTIFASKRQLTEVPSSLTDPLCRPFISNFENSKLLYDDKRYFIFWMPSSS